jgi:hypothetical protein
VLFHAAESRGSMNYLNLANEILEKNGYIKPVQQDLNPELTTS